MTTGRDAKYKSADEAAEYLGVSRRTFYEHVRREVRTVRIGTRVRFKTDELDSWAERHSSGGIEQDAPEPVELLSPNEERAKILHQLEAQPDMKRMSNRTRALIAKLGRT